MEMKFTDDNFEAEVLKSEIPVFVDFYADWCNPCKMMAPLVGQIAEEYEGRVKVGKMNIDDNESTALKYRIMSIPTFLVFKNGEVVNTVMGISKKAELEQAIKSAL